VISELIGKNAETLMQYNILRACLNQEKIHMYGNIKASETLVFRGIEIEKLTSQKTRNKLVKERQCDVQFNGLTIGSDIWNQLFKCTSDTGLLSIQWKIFHGIYPHGGLLKKYNIEQSDLCKLCNEVDNIEHFFIHCNAIKNIWKDVALNDNEKIGMGILDKKLLYKSLVIKKTIHDFKFSKNERKNISVMFEYEKYVRNIVD
ncbi:unnamed protein product, partial [Owenia fusiformis]